MGGSLGNFKGQKILTRVRLWPTKNELGRVLA
ncbi:hypothetical protein CYB_1114 [Synechococcus sp. JA-2-3B'a(2-13)]|nr:hypothetical protein CYB_1114 [Synechococcus sp. JA-2-3B'a(2-13)]